MKVRILYKIDDSVAIIHPAPKSKREDETEDQWLDRVFAKATPVGIDYDDVEDTELPLREDRNYWRKLKGQPFTIDNAAKDLDETEEVREKLIKDKIRNTAIKELEKEGKL